MNKFVCFMFLLWIAAWVAPLESKEGPGIIEPILNKEGPGR